VNSSISARHHVARVGNLLVEGPFSIRPPDSVDDYGWLECQLRLTHWTDESVESAAVYVDDSMNRQEAFLSPVIRHLRWTKAQDLQSAAAGELRFPNVSVSLSYFAGAETEVDALIRGVQTRLSHPPLVPSGLTTDRSVPDLPGDFRSRVMAYASNGAQGVEYRAWSSPADNGLSEAIVTGIARLRSLISPLDLAAGWRESYPYALTSADLGSSWWWDYRSGTAVAAT
jgi:hypothetical protein